MYEFPVHIGCGVVIVDLKAQADSRSSEHKVGRRKEERE
jgi:hypothetical protein